MSIAISNLTAGYHSDFPVLNGVNLTVEQGRITMLIGPNGCGKSTLLKSIGRLMPPKSGTITVNGLNTSQTSSKRLAREIAFLPQDPIVPSAITVEQLVGYGRAPHQSILGFRSTEDVEVIEEAIATTGISHLRNKLVSELSGGQRQNVFIAMVLAQSTPCIMLDEPTNHLDLTHQIELLELLHSLNRTQGKTIVIVMHDLNLAARYADHMVLMREGRILGAGTPEKIMTEDYISEAFSMACRIVRDPVYEKPLCIPYPWHTHQIAARARGESQLRAVAE